MATDRLFDSLRRNRSVKPSGTLSGHHVASSDAIRGAVRTYFAGLERDAPVPSFDEAKRAEALVRAIDDAAGLHSITVEDGAVQRVAKRVAASAKLSAPDGSPAFWQRLHAVKRALDEHASR